MPSKYVDTTAIIQVIGCTFNNPSLLDDNKYTITDEDFADEFHRTIFGAIYKLHELGAREITLETISDFFSSRPKSEAIYKKNKGEEWLRRTSENANELSFNYYYGRLKKFSLLRAYDNCGVDVTEIYDPDNIFDTSKKQEQENILDNSSLELLADKIDGKIQEIRLKFADGGLNEAQQAGAGIDDLIDLFKETPEVGIPLYGPLINTVTRGARLKKFYLRSMPSGYGKAIPNYTLIPTPSGFKRVDEIKLGDCLFGRDGKPTKVIGIYPQPEKKRVWEIVFKDGRMAECCEEHLWSYYYTKHRGLGIRTESLKEINRRVAESGLKNGDGFKFKIPLNEPVEFPKRELSIDPYILGLIIGDGSLRYNKTNKAFFYSSSDIELVESIAKFFGCIYKKNSDFNFNYTFKPIDNLKHNLWVEEILKDYPELWQLKSEDKFIPEEFLFSSIEQRFSLLQGLLDTDGCINKEKGRVSFTTVSPKLRDNVIWLCRSLGFVCNYCIDKRSEKYTTGECYSISIQCKKEIKSKLFRLKRKVEIAENYINNGKRRERKDYNPIIDIRKTDRFEEMTCFEVDNEDHLFLMNDFIVTHNTRSMIADACNFACRKIYDESFGWLNMGSGQPTLFITTEQELSEIQTMMLAFLSAVNEEHILNGTYEPGEEERVREAAEELKSSPLYIEEMPDFSLEDVENAIKKGIREHGIKYICHDYIHSSMKILSEIASKSGGIKLREDNILFMLSNKLKDLCNQYGVFIMSSTQLSGDFNNAETPDQNLLRGAKSLADKIDFGCIGLGVKPDDLAALEQIISTNGFEPPNLKISIYKNRRGRYKGIYLWCKADLGICRIKPMFATTYTYNMVSIDDVRIRVEDEKPPWEE